MVKLYLCNVDGSEIRAESFDAAKVAAETAEHWLTDPANVRAIVLADRGDGRRPVTFSVPPKCRKPRPIVGREDLAAWAARAAESPAPDATATPRAARRVLPTPTPGAAPGKRPRRDVAKGAAREALRDGPIREALAAVRPDAPADLSPIWTGPRVDPAAVALAAAEVSAVQADRIAVRDAAPARTIAAPDAAPTADRPVRNVDVSPAPVAVTLAEIAEIAAEAGASLPIVVRAAVQAGATIAASPVATVAPSLDDRDAAAAARVSALCVAQRPDAETRTRQDRTSPEIIRRARHVAPEPYSRDPARRMGHDAPDTRDAGADTSHPYVVAVNGGNSAVRHATIEAAIKHANEYKRGRARIYRLEPRMDLMRDASGEAVSVEIPQKEPRVRREAPTGAATRGADGRPVGRQFKSSQKVQGTGTKQVTFRVQRGWTWTEVHTDRYGRPVTSPQWRDVDAFGYAERQEEAKAAVDAGKGIAPAPAPKVAPVAMRRAPAPAPVEIHREPLRATIADLARR